MNHLLTHVCVLLFCNFSISFGSLCIFPVHRMALREHATSDSEVVLAWGLDRLLHIVCIEASPLENKFLATLCMWVFTRNIHIKSSTMICIAILTLLVKITLILYFCTKARFHTDLTDEIYRTKVNSILKTDFV